MRQKLLSFLLALVASAGAMAADVPGITVEYLDDGAPYIQAISAIARIEFDSGTKDVLLKFKDANVPDYNLGNITHGNIAEIRKINFGQVDESQITEQGNSGSATAINAQRRISVSVYPNPTANHIHIDGLAEGETARLFSTDGRLVLSGVQADFDLGALPKGIYLLQVGAEVIKITKK